MKFFAIGLLAIITLLRLDSVWSGMQIVIADPLYFEQTHEVIFPWADAKIVTFEFNSVADILGGKERAKELHDQFLRNIQGLPGGAILTYLSREGQRIENYRFTAREEAKKQKAQMVLWGRMFPDESGASLINVRLELIEPPRGIQAKYESRIDTSTGQQQPIRGVISDEISQTRIDFLTVEESNVGALADFLSGLAFYYKGAKKENARSKRLLRTAIERLGKYLNKTRNKIDYSAASAARLYIARAYYVLSSLENDKRRSHLTEAERHGKLAIELNPYESDPYTVMAVIRTAQSRNSEQIAELLTKAVARAPGSSTSSYNLALVRSGIGQFKNAIQRLEQVEYLQLQQQQTTYKDLNKLQDQLRAIEQRPLQ
jgi:hypothetical protein